MVSRIYLIVIKTDSCLLKGRLVIISKKLKYNVICIITVLMIIIATGCTQKQDASIIDISGYTIDETNSYRGNHRAEKLNNEDKIIYEELCEKIENFQSGEVILEEVSIKQFYDIWDCISLENNYFYVYQPLVLTKDDTVPKNIGENEKRFEKAILIFAFEQEWREAGFTDEDRELLVDDTDNVVIALNLQEYLEKYVKFGENAVERYKNEQTEISLMLDEVACNVPNTENLKEILDYFQKYLYENFEYDNNAQYELEKNIYNGADAALYTRNVGCVLSKKGTCTGFARVFVELCKRKNIDAYVVDGTYTNNMGQKVAHAWGNWLKRRKCNLC